VPGRAGRLAGEPATQRVLGWPIRAMLVAPLAAGQSSPAAGDSAAGAALGCRLPGAVRAAGMLVNQYVYAPFGADPLLLHDVVLRNLTGRARRVTWYEYWNVNPLDQQTHLQLGLAAPATMPRCGR
jgi:hypothetical protein